MRTVALLVSLFPISAIVLFVGGAWLGGDVEQVVPQARYLAQRGMIAIVADYRLVPVLPK
jgi:acetyl esterase/lipase